MRHPEIPPDLRGTYAGLAHPAAIEHLRRLGVTAVELMPVHQFVHDHYLIDRGLRNYWGYNSIGFFAPHNEYSAWGVAQVVSEFRYLVKTLHEAGLEVILDVVYTTPRRVITSARCCRSKGSTTARTTGLLMAAATTSTSPARGTR
jgi:isoamylase